MVVLMSKLQKKQVEPNTQIRIITMNFATKLKNFNCFQVKAQGKNYFGCLKITQ